jgi:hypothetical protein
MPPYDDNDDNGLGETSPVEGKLGTILIHVGETRKGIKRLEGDVREIKETLRSVITTGECGRRMDSVSSSLAEIMQDVREVRGKKGTGATYSAVLPTGPMPAPKPEDIVEEYFEGRRERARRSVTFWITTASLLAALLGGSALALVKLGLYVDRVEAGANEGLKREREEAERFRQEVQQELLRQRNTFRTPAVDARIPIPAPRNAPRPHRAAGR